MWDRPNKARTRLHALLLSLAAILAVLPAAALTAPDLAPHAGFASFEASDADDGRTGDDPNLSELGGPQCARPLRDEPRRPGGSLGPFSTATGATRVARVAASLAAAAACALGTWPKEAKTRAELMVFLN